MTRPPTTPAHIGVFSKLRRIDVRRCRRVTLPFLLLSILAQFSATLHATDFEHLRPTAFQGITPGVTTLKQLRAKFDDRVRRKNSNWHIDVGAPFRSVVARESDKRVASIHAELITPWPLKKTMSELGLSTPIPPLRTESGGKGRQHWFFPERGLKLYASATPKQHVQAITLVPLESDELLARFTAGESVENELQLLESLQRRGFLDQAGKLRLIEWHLRAGHAGDAEVLLTELKLDDGFHRQLLRARHRLWTGEPTRLERLHIPQLKTQPLLTASRQLSWARVFATPQVAELDRAAKLITDAIDQLNQHKPSQAALADRLRLEANLVLLQVIATGDRDDKLERLELSLDNTELLLEQMVSPAEDPLYKLQAIRRVLEALVNVEQKVSYQRWQFLAKAAVEQAAERVDGPLRRSELALERSRIHRQLAGLARGHGDVTAATHHAKISLRLLDDVEHDFCHVRQQIERTETLFLLGVLQAIEMNDHVAAAQWYKQAAEHLTLIDAESYVPGKIADRWISMGVSYWTIGQKTVALELTERGKRRIDRFVKSGRLPASALITCFQNLSTMHGVLGNETQSGEYLRWSRVVGESSRTR
ncbi:MAG TPA: hypothetical protein EYG57_16210 [Planctomycetes bacterium]|nr:hypothetical protein [Planctomycetaceae bacterium]HIM31079.1 hypothetical protein [Planctomycetota bacterium]